MKYIVLKIMVEQFFYNIGLGWLLLFFFMSCFWLIHFPLKNAALVDAGWGLSLFMVACLYTLQNTKDTFTTRSVVLLSMVGIWSIRLSFYLFFTRIWKAKEEGRYVALRESWKPNIGLKFFLFYQSQGLLNIFLSLPFLFISLNTSDKLQISEIFFCFLFLIGWFGETISDYQLHSFKKSPTNKGKVCDKGLWYYSRHPNYFFESLVWVSWGGFALLSPYGFIGLIAPVLIITSIFKVTGIPATEEQNRKTKGIAWEEYVKSTSVFFPWFKKT